MRRFSLPGRLAQSALLAALTLALSVPALAATITVDSSTDDGTGGCTLREAVESANTDTGVGGCSAGTGNDTILFDSGVTFIQLTSQIAITDPVVVFGNGSAVTTISGASANRVFEVQANTSFEEIEITSAGSNATTGYPTDGGAIYIVGNPTVSASNVIFSGHQVSGSGGAVWVPAGAVFQTSASSGTVEFTGNRARGTAATQGGGAIYNAGTVSLTNATFTDNRALGTSGSGGAILTSDGGSGGGLAVTNVTFTGNRAQRAGGAIEAVGGTTSIVGSTFSGNIAGSNPGNGGAVHGGGFAEILISETSATGNRAVEGGAFWISADGSLGLQGVAVSSNVATGASADQGGGGVYVDGGILTIVDGAGPSVFSDNRATGASGSGGAILVNDGSLSIEGASFSQNRSQRAGGAIEVTAPTAGSEVDVVITGATFSNNVTGSAPGNGGGIHTTQGLIGFQIGNTVFSANEAASEGGGLWTNTGTTLTLSGSVFSGNVARGTAPDNGGGGLFVNGGDASVSTTTFEDNASGAASGGGVMAVAGSVLIDQSLLVNNSAGTGGGLASLSGATTTVQNSTLYGNTARFGGGAFSNVSLLSFDSATIASNTASIGGGGLYNQNPPNLGVPFVTLTNTIVATNTAANGPNLKGRHASGGWNVIGTTPDTPTFPAVASDQTGTDPMLDMLADNGGPTLTAALMAGSPAIDAGSTDLTVDQRGVARTEPDDVGAVEFGDAAAGPALLITGVFDGPLSGGVPKAIELYVLEDVADLSVYGVSSANNGGGPTGSPEFTFPADAATAGDYLYVASEATGFTTFFGFAPDYTAGAAGINGDDAIELFLDGAVVDVFGEVSTDGTGQPWDYDDGWAYRQDATGPDGSTFVLGNWVFSGTDANNDDTTQDTATNPWPIGTYSPVLIASATGASVTTAAELDRLTVAPNPFRSAARATFAVTDAQAVTVTLYDVMGRQVQQVYSGAAQAEQAIEVSVDGSSLASGVYVLVLQGETIRATRQVTVAR